MTNNKIEIPDVSHGEVELTFRSVEWIAKELCGKNKPIITRFSTKLDAMLYIKKEVETLNKFYDEYDNYKNFELIPVVTYEGSPYKWDEYELATLIKDELYDLGFLAKEKRND